MASDDGGRREGWLRGGALGSSAVVVAAIGVFLRLLAGGASLAGAPPSSSAAPGASDAPALAAPRTPEPSAYCVAALLAPLRGAGVLAESVAIEGAEAPSADGGAIAPPARDPLDRDHGAIAIDGGGSDGRAATAPRLGPFDALLAAARDRAGVEVRIATLPDPIDSGSRYAFDAALQSLRLGVERGTPDGRHFFRDASWLPWADAAGGAASEACRETTPGVVVFRAGRARGAAGGPAKVASVLLLVGETATTGVHRAALVHALAIAHALGGAGAAGPKAACQKIVGPTFSGGASSLRAALDAWAGEAKTPCPEGSSIRVRTGSATGPDVGDILRGAELRVSGAPVAVDFARTTRLESDVQCEFFEYARSHLGVDPVDDPEKKGGKILPGVAVLRESGTEFGEAAADGACRTSPEMSLSFPFHVAAIRDAYEDMDERARRGAEKSAGVGRATSLDVSLRDDGKPSDADVAPSPKTTAAEDVALSNLLSELSREGVRYVGIQATDSSDAIFLARKIRDVAPDVRLVFFQNDILLTHPAFRRDLVGSFVVTPYPFFGADDFSRRRDNDARGAEGPNGVRFHAHEPFDGEVAEGIYNATLAVEAFPVDDLAEYTFFEGPRGAPASSGRAGGAAVGGVLPVWIAAIASGGIVPVHVQKEAACGETYAGVTPAAPAGPCSTDAIAGAELDVDPDKSPPNLWHFLYAALVVGALADRIHQRRQRAIMPPVSFDRVAPGGADRALDLALGRAKFHFYLTARSLVFAVALAYVGAVHLLALRAYGSVTWRPLPWSALVAGAIALVLAVHALLRSAARYRDRVLAIRAFVARTSRAGEPRAASAGAPAEGAPPDSMREESAVVRGLARAWAPLAVALGVRDASRGAFCAAATSLRQLRLLTVVGAVVAVSFAVAIGFDLHAHGFAWRPLVEGPRRPAPELTIFVLRSLPLVNGVSPSAPILLSFGVVYAWALGRLARLRLAHGLSLMTPNDGVDDAVSTPIAMILFGRPGHTPLARPADPEGFTQIERDLLDTIWRPSTRPGYLATLAGLTFFIAILFALKAPSTLESRAGTLLLFGALSLSSVLIAATLLQFGAYWRALDLVLKRIVAHPLGHAFAWVDGFVREPIEDQVSGSPNDLLRLSAAASRFAELVRTLPPSAAGSAWSARVVELAALRDPMLEARDAALSASTTPLAPSEATLAGGEVLGQKVIEAAEAVCRALELAWCEPGSVASSAHEEPTSSARDPLAPLDGRVDASALGWLRGAQAFVATVIALLVNRHVRQFRYFAYALTGMALLLLGSLSVYAFEPFRLLLTCIWVIMAAVVFRGFWTFIELERNTLLSLIGGTEPGKVTVNATLVLRVVGWVILPLVSVAAAQYPQVGATLSSWVEPFAHALR